MALPKGYNRHCDRVVAKVDLLAAMRIISAEVEHPQRGVREDRANM